MLEQVDLAEAGGSWNECLDGLHLGVLGRRSYRLRDFATSTDSFRSASSKEKVVYSIHISQIQTILGVFISSALPETKTRRFIQKKVIVHCIVKRLKYKLR